MTFDHLLRPQKARGQEDPHRADTNAPWIGGLPPVWRERLTTVAMIGWDGLSLDALLWTARHSWGLPINDHAYWKYLVAAWLLPLGLAILGLYPGYAVHPARQFRKRAYAISFAFALILTDLVLDQKATQRIVLSLFGCYALAFLFWPIGGRLFQRLLRLGGWRGSPVVVLGAGEAGRALVRGLFRDSAIGLQPMAFYDDDPEKVGHLVEGIPVLGPLPEARQATTFANIAILALPALSKQALSNLTAQLPFSRMLMISNFHGVQTMWLRGADLGGRFFFDIPNKALLLRNRSFKRTMDLIIGVPLALCVAPVVLLLAVGIRWKSPGTPFYSQEREGRDGRLIRVWKLRTMYMDSQERLDRHLAECPEARTEWEHRFKLKEDPRIVPILGIFLRRTSLDELPQLWNVIKGEMSLVGPRPFPSYHLGAFSDEFRKLRRRVTPGMTGLWQVSAREDGDLETQERLDTFYIQNWSVWLDVDILLKTAGVIVRGTGT